jgi:hypothetical protein
MKHFLVITFAGLVALLALGCAGSPSGSGQPTVNPTTTNPADLTDGTFVFKVKKVNGTKVIQSINGTAAEEFINTPIYKIVDALVKDADRLFATGLKEYGKLANLREGESTELTLRMKDGNVLL